MTGRKNRWRRPKPRKPRKKSEREIRIEAAIRDWDTLSKDLSVKDKYKLAKDIRGSGALPKGLKAMLTIPTNDMWQKLTKKVTLAIIAREGAHRSDRVVIPIRMPYNFRACLPDFPTGSKMIDADVLSITMLYNCCAVLDWLHERCYSRYSSRQLRRHIHVFNKWLSEWENEFNILNLYGYDSEIVAEYANVIEQFENEGESNE